MEIKTANDLAQKTCRICGRELPEEYFPKGRGGGRGGVCKECRESARRETLMRNRTQMGGVNRPPFPTPTSTAKTSAKSGGRCAARRSGLKAVDV